MAADLIAASQAQKHITHNDALRLLDILTQLAVIGHIETTPPGNPAVGDRHIVAAGGGGGWAGHDGEIAIHEATGWAFVPPVAGLVAFDLGSAALIYFDGAAWGEVPANLTASDMENLSGVGINATPDATNRLSVSAPATLLNHEGAGHQVKINKAAPGDTGSLLYQTNWSGRAEMGLAGDDNWSVKVSPDGSTWTTAPIIDRRSGDMTTGAALRVGRYATAARPSAGASGAGAMIYDADLSRPVWSDGTDWRDATGALA